MKMNSAFLLAVSPLVLLAGCAVVPTGPSVMALPGTGKNFEQFRSDDVVCRQYALQQVGGTSADRAAVDSGVRSAAIGTVVGAVAGAAIGGHDAAGVGAGTGLLMGSMVGAETAQRSAYGTQQHYDNAYIQCMYAKGQRVPVPADLARNQSQAPAAPPAAAPANTSYPPPPPGYVSPPRSPAR